MIDAYPCNMACFVRNVSGARAFVIDDAIDLDACTHFLDRAKAKGFERGVFAGDRTRAVVDDDALSYLIWEAVRNHVGPTQHDQEAMANFTGPGSDSIPFGTYAPYTVASLMRVSRYVPGGSFSKHTDTCYARDDQYVGLWTILLYLDDVVDGGKTVVLDGVTGLEAVRVRPQAGRILAFHMDEVHEGTRVVRGEKHVCRTEIVFRRVPGC